MKHFTNKITNETWGYESSEEAKEFNPDFENLAEMDEKTFLHFRDDRPKGGKWTVKGWVEDEALMQEHKAQEQARLIQQKKDDLDIIETKITRLERIKKRTETEEQELDALIEQSTVLFREIKATEAEE